MTLRDIQTHIEEMCCAEVSSTLISAVTDAVLDETKARQSLPVNAIYPIANLLLHPCQNQRFCGGKGRYGVLGSGY